MAHDTYVALLRGINVGGRHKLPMKALARLFEAVGCRDVRTYIQSGNVVFGIGSASPDGLADEVGRRIRAGFGFEAPVVLRRADALEAVIAANPFLGEGAEEGHLHVGFLAGRPSDEAVESLDPARSDVDSFRVVGTEVYLHVPGGMGRTKLTTDWFDRRLETTMTVRNWRTVTKLVALSHG